jgi:hypothetical protein
MDNRFQVFLSTVAAWGGRSLRDLPASGDLPSPWDAWTLLGLLRFRELQYWVAEVVRSKLGGDLGRLATVGALGHPEQIPGAGIVPGLPDWEYHFHGRGCMLTRRKDGMEIDVDFVDDGAEFIDAYFYRNHLKSLREPEPVERRVLALHPSIDAIEVSLGVLHQTGLLDGKSCNHFKIAPELLARVDDVTPALRRWESESQSGATDPFSLWLASGEQGALERRERRAALTVALNGERNSAALRGLADLGIPDLESHLQQVLKGPAGAAMSAALEMISTSDDPKWCGELYAVLDRTPSSSADGTPYAQVRCLEFLFRHAYRKVDLRRALSRDWGAMEGEVALIAMEHAPDLALHIVRRALRSSIPLSRQEAAALLAAVDRPWSRRELLAVLDESDDHHLSAAARAGLRLCHDPHAAEALAHWELTHYRAPIAGRFIKVDEGILRMTDEMVAWHLQEIHDRVMKIRDVEPT